MTQPPQQPQPPPPQQQPPQDVPPAFQTAFPMESRATFYHSIANQADSVLYDAHFSTLDAQQLNTLHTKFDQVKESAAAGPIVRQVATATVQPSVTPSVTPSPSVPVSPAGAATPSPTPMPPSQPAAPAASASPVSTPGPAG